MKNEIKILLSFLIILTLVLAGCSNETPNNVADNTNSKDNNDVNTKQAKIGVITDLSGGAAYWGESTRVGAELAKQDLAKQGYNVDVIFEDYQLEASKALTAAQKLVNVDSVDAIYAEFDTAAEPVAGFVKDKEILFIYDSATVSPLENNELVYKTYLDYKEGCKQVALKFKEDGVENIGVLKINIEPGQLCLEGVREVYPENTFKESYNLGDKDFKTQFLKFKNNDVEAVINVGYEGNTLDALKVIKEQELDMKYGTVDDTITKTVLETYSEELKGSYSFGFQEVSEEFSARITEDLATEYGAAIAYTHVMQMGKALADCDDNMECVKQKMDSSVADSTIGFQGFNNHIAELNMNIKAR